MSVDQTLLFKCVCGASIGMDCSAGGICKSCGRNFSTLAANCAATIALNAAAAPAASDDQMLGKSFDHFTIVDRLGAGGMGTVYRALDESLQRYVALKMLRPSSDMDGVSSTGVSMVKTLLEEARAQARVNHANVVHVYYVSRDPKMPYLAMELLPDGTVADALKKGKLAYVDVVRIASQVAEALRESSKLAIVHGDIKPCNILLAGNTAKLSDFGLAQRVASKSSGEGGLSGTPNYMAPEMFSGSPSSPQSDMYSFGVMLFEMTFGRLPYSFSDSSVLSRVEAHTKRQVEFPEPWPAEVPEAWKAFLAKLLAKRPDQRFEHWDALLKQLNSLRPIQPVIAGRFKRGIAWGIDLVAQLVVMLALQRVLERLLPDSKFFGWLMLLSSLIVPALMMLWISRGRSTPGKALMQLKIVDHYGLPKNRRLLALRSIIPYLPIWLLPTAERTEVVGLPGWIWQPLWITLGLFLLANIVFAVFRRNGKSLHDQLFDTRVVLGETH